MPHMPVELAGVSEDTDIVGDIDAFITYIESGQARCDWDERLTEQTEECDAFLREHGHVWSHIIIQGASTAPQLSRAA